MERVIIFVNFSFVLIFLFLGFVINGCSLYLYLVLVLIIGIIRYLYIRVLCNKICWIVIYYVEEMYFDDF